MTDSYVKFSVRRNVQVLGLGDHSKLIVECNEFKQCNLEIFKAVLKKYIESFNKEVTTELYKFLPDVNELFQSMKVWELYGNGIFAIGINTLGNAVWLEVKYVTTVPEKMTYSILKAIPKRIGNTNNIYIERKIITPNIY